MFISAPSPGLADRLQATFSKQFTTFFAKILVIPLRLSAVKPHLMSKDFMLVSKALGVSYKLVAEHLNGSLVGVGGHESATTHRREGRERERAAVEAYVLHSLVWVNSFLMQGEMFSHYSLVGTA